MKTSNKQKEQQSVLHSALWSMANDLRGTMDAYEFKSYILGLIFYRYLSEKVEKEANELLTEDKINYKEAYADEEYKEDLTDEIIGTLGYTVAPKYIFSNLIEEIHEGNFDVELLEKAISSISSSSLGTDSQEDFEDLFEDMDLKSTKLGRTVKERSKLIAKIMLGINDLSLDFEDSEIDVLGDAYEYLIGMFAQTAGKKAGEFYTPQQVSKILAKIVTHGKNEIKNVYDPCCGSGSLLLRVGKEANVISYEGQEITATTYNLARMNMLLHGIPYQNFHIINGDTLEEPALMGKEFSAIVSNPPYSVKWSADPSFMEDPRFSGYGKLAPKSKADFAFVQHMLYYLEENGTMAVVLPHGVLFRGAAEENIRKIVIRDRNYLDAVIGLPSNLFYGTSIPTCILVFKKNRNGNRNNVLFIDASKEFEKGKNQNILKDENIDKIIDTYVNRKEIEKYSHVALVSEIEENEYNLNIPRYVDTFEEEPEIDLAEVSKDIRCLQREIKEINTELKPYFSELGLDFPFDEEDRI